MTDDKGSHEAAEETPAEPVFSPPDSPAAPSDKLVVSRAAAAANAPQPTMVDGFAAQGQQSQQAQESPWASGAQRLPESAPPPPRYQDAPPPYQDAPPPYGDPRPGFAPARQGAYWPGTQPAAPPQPLIPGMQPPPPPPPGGQGGVPGGPGAPNWAPVPPPAAAPRRTPGVGVFAIGALIIALVAGAVGAGVAVVATDDAPSTTPISIGGGGGSAGQQARDPQSVAGIAQKVLPSVVTIKVSLGNGEGGSGTGFIVKGGYIITNNHVVEAGGGGTPSINVVFSDDKEVAATVVGTSAENDVAVLKTQGQHDLPALELGDSDALAPGDPVIAIGSPLGLTGSVTTGIISAKDRVVPTGDENGSDGGMITALQTDAAINPGNSGGPLVNAADGKVIGMNTAIASLSQGSGESGSIGLGFAIPINKVSKVADALIEGKTVKKTMIGISMNTQYQGDGVQILDSAQGIVKGGPADQAGLKPGDLILKVDDRPVTSTDALVAIISSHAPGDAVTVTYRRGGQESTVKVTLGQG
ncbi:S1C family serine protease [Actinocorallia sp. A-T 12471]|uniref:S1C family serine protease n=1 Tax=Actinocorallia sp. A-T 12471 TaxID=3089813 RepID=UPI0029CFA213|nr:trypsin-like peptidase domain-containing protein [Actinocorallia sp. A-T 12471]MDX6738789.1 trypsin-like peptidase domain-containing protein [Actinocorallia sp. A-T 12471]